MTTFVSVAIPYVNAAPHLGYAYELVEADVFARSRRSAGAQVRFLGGTDDYSLKNVLAAQAAGVSTSEFVRANGDRFEALAGPLGLSFDDFIRTSTDARHKPAVERLWRACAANGDLYKRTYEGDYCVGCEQFYDVSDLTDGCCPEHATPLERVAEQNWFFRLSIYRDHLVRLIDSGELCVHPEPFRDEVLSFLAGGLNDISVSRSVERARGWGIGVPDDPTQVIYVWFDALTNYISSLDFGEPESTAYRKWWLNADERIHVIGKGIVRFHAVFWPAFLASAGQPAPTRIQVHPHITVDGAKLSKSAGATIDPVGVAETFGSDAIRWWFARDVSPTVDTDFTTERLVSRANEDLANGLGNVTNRIVTLVNKLRDGYVPDVGADPIAAAETVERAAHCRFGQFDMRGAANAINAAVTALNQDLEATKPWKLAGVDDQALVLDRLLDSYVQSATRIAAAASAIVPALAAKLVGQLDRTGRLPEPAPQFARLG